MGSFGVAGVLLSTLDVQTVLFRPQRTCQYSSKEDLVTELLHTV